MKKLDTKVNIIPIIAKADTISKTELQKFKVMIYILLRFNCDYCEKFTIKWYFLQSKIISELQSNGVNIYQFPTDDESVTDINTQMNAHVPFAVVGSTDFVRVGNKMMRSRQYPWGTVQGKRLNLKPYTDYNHKAVISFSYSSWKWITLWFRKTPWNVN